MTTFRFTVEEFQRLLDVVLADDAPDSLTNLILTECTRPRDGVILVPVPPADARALRDLVQTAARRDPRLAGFARLVAEQAAEGDVS